MPVLLAGHKLGGPNGETVDLEWVSKMVVEVLDWALASDNGLDEETEHGEHGKTAVLDLLDLQVCKQQSAYPNDTSTTPCLSAQ